MSSVEYGSLPFAEQIAFFRQKINLPTASWTDIFDGQHARAFVVAGAMKSDLLVDLRQALDRVIAEGATLADFRRDFDALVARSGWVYNGGRNWRSRVIYETNLNSAYMAGRWQQMQQVRRTRPYWRYVHSPFVENPRLDHLSWDGLVLRHDDPFWSTHYPPNGWGCKCRVETLSERNLKALGKDAPDTAPPLQLEERTVGIRGPNPRTVRVPTGIDPGFGFNVGEAAYGRQLSDVAMDEWKARKGDAWEILTPKTWADVGRPSKVPLDAPVALPVTPAASVAEIAARLREQLGGNQKVYDVKGLPITINAEVFAQHMDDLSRSAYLPLIEEALADPFEVWLAFERHKGTGLVTLRARIIKAVNLGKGRSLLMVANAAGGQLQGWTFVPHSNLKYLSEQRYGELVWGRP